jgi:high-affinity Fe2+/Pb2+ permease
MISSKNGQGMPINVIILLVLGLLVLVILGWIFSREAVRIPGASSCSGQGGVCMSEQGMKCAGNETIIMTSDCKMVKDMAIDESSKQGQCCIPVFR